MPEYALTTGTPAEFDPPKNRRTNRRAVKETERHKESRVSIIVKADGGSNFPPHPVGAFPAICIDVMERLNVETKYGVKNRIQVRFYCGEEVMHDGEMMPRLERARACVASRSRGGASRSRTTNSLASTWRIWSVLLRSSRSRTT